MKKNKLFFSISAISLLFITAFIFSATMYINANFANQSVDEIIYYLFNGLGGTSSDVFINAFSKSLVPFLFLFLFLLLPIMPLKIRNNIIELIVKNKKFKITLFPNKFLFKYRLVYASMMFFLSLIACFRLLGINEFYSRLTNYSTMIDDNYVSGTDISITFPDFKRNLIILYLESAENTLMDKKAGGGWNYSVIPELENIALQNTNFSNTNKIGGPLPIAGTGWTVGGLVSSTSGIPLKIPVNGNAYTTSDKFLSGAYTLGDILYNEGYNLEVMFGSDANFGGRRNYYTRHGKYKIYDVHTAINEEKMSESDIVWWGFDDTHLFNWAKEEITELASLEKPFSISLLTANTHFPDGYVENGTENIFESQYENVFAYSSKQVSEFITWVEQQEFYKNTTIVIVGDHHSMQDPEFFNSRMYEGYDRTIYNSIINSPTEPLNSKNRLFTLLDMFPTILASIGVEIEGNRLGLGTNLFSNRKTLAEEVGISSLDVELAKNSKFYNENILQDDYLDLIKKAQRE
jgi:phosphoglycerol transferase